MRLFSSLVGPQVESTKVLRLNLCGTTFTGGPESTKKYSILLGRQDHCWWRLPQHKGHL